MKKSLNENSLKKEKGKVTPFNFLTLSYPFWTSGRLLNLFLWSVAANLVAALVYVFVCAGLIR